MFGRIELHEEESDRFTELLENIWLVISFFNSRIQSSEKTRGNNTEGKSEKARGMEKTTEAVIESPAPGDLEDIEEGGGVPQPPITDKLFISNTRERIWSVEDVLELIRKHSRSWRSGVLKVFNELRFTYEVSQLFAWRQARGWYTYTYICALSNAWPMMSLCTGRGES